MTNIGMRLKILRTRLGIKMPVIEKFTSISKGKLYKWEKGVKPTNLEDYNKLNAYLDKMENKQEIDVFEIEISSPATLKLPIKNNKPAKPQTDGMAASGTVIFTGKVPELIVDRIDAPFLSFLEGAIQVIGHSMKPTFCNGSWVTITRLNDFRALDWGHYYYLIDSNYIGSIRRVYQSEKENSLQLISDNPDQLEYPPTERCLDHIKAIFKIGASITKF
jgi:transcriptional regulator with XRE-family HTH domain